VPIPAAYLLGVQERRRGWLTNNHLAVKVPASLGVLLGVPLKNGPESFAVLALDYKLGIRL
jgi:hypothetical protein